MKRIWDRALGNSVARTWKYIPHSALKRSKPSLAPAKGVGGATLGGLGLRVGAGAGAGTGAGAGVTGGWFRAWLSTMAWSPWNQDSSSSYCSSVTIAGEAGEIRLKPSSAVKDRSDGEGVPA